jgi:hypothetical protein
LSSPETPTGYEADLGIKINNLEADLFLASLGAELDQVKASILPQTPPPAASAATHPKR